MDPIIVPGTIAAYGGTQDSLVNLEGLGWIVCDGRLYDRTDEKYKRLFGSIGTSWGGDGGNKFAVPDLRGQFLRGISDTTGTDPDAASRQTPRPDLNNSGNKGNAVGSRQPDELRSHSHAVNPDHPYMDNYAPGHTNGTEGGDDVNYTPRSISIGNTGGHETRPVNAYVYYIIKL